MTKKIIAATFFLIATSGISAQEISIKVTDSKTGEGLPQANITLNSLENLITDADGNFRLPAKFNQDDTTINASYLGYKAASATLGRIKQQNLTISLEPVSYELQEVAVNKVKLTADTIMTRVKKNLSVNYKSSAQPRKVTLFLRESTVFTPIQAIAEMSKSSKVKKKDLDKVNAELKSFANELIAHPPAEATDFLGNYYSTVKTVKDKPAYVTKFNVEKGVKFNNDRQSLSMQELEKKGMKILMKHLDSTKIYRIKSGLFGTRDTVIGGNQKVKVKDKPNLTAARNTMTLALSQNNIIYGYQMNFATNPNLYEYTLAGTVPYGEDGYAYKLNFKPRKRKAKYAGTLYISPTDYAVLRADYDLAEGKTMGSLNLKLILGIKQVENVSRGTLVYKEREEGGYYLHYASKEDGQYVYVNRPLKFIEITDGDKEKVAYDLKVELNLLDKKEYLCMARTGMTEADFDKIAEEEFTYLKPEVYDPTVWNAHTTLKPLEQMRKIKQNE